MAYIHKATVYFIDPDEQFENADAISWEMRSYDSLPHMKVGKSETKDFDWDDEVVVNKVNCTGEQAEEFFQNVTQKKVIPKYWYSVVINDRFVESICKLDSYNQVRYTEIHEDAIKFMNSDRLPDYYPIYYIDVEAESPEQAEYIVKEKVLEYVRNKQLKRLEKIRKAYFEVC